MALTVYLDSSFYIQLVRMNDEDAREVVSALNALEVRPVLSFTLMRELMRNPNRSEADAKLHALVSLFARPSFITTEHMSWDWLLATGERRRELADTLAHIDRALVAAESAGVVANTAYPHGLKAAAAASALAKAPYLDASGNIDIAKFRDLLVQYFGLLGIEVPDPLTEESVRVLKAALASRFPPGTSEAVETKSRLVASTVATDNRPYGVVLGTAPDKSSRDLAHTYRDGNHMDEFARHADVIDVLQIDGPQYAQLEKDASHELRRLGLAERCFMAATPGDAVSWVREYVGA